MMALTPSPHKTPCWHLPDPEILPETDPSHLCPTCRHVNFRYLIFDIPFLQCPEIPLGSLQRALSTHSCAFCKLVRATILDVFRSDFDTIPLELEGEPVMLSVMPFPETLDPSKPRQLVLHLRPSPWKDNKLDRTMGIQVIGKDAFLNHDGFGRLLDPVKVNNLVALYWIRTCRMGYGLHKEDRPREVHGQPPPGFRLIDLKRNCIVPAGSLSYDYVTLSYVWPPPGKPILKLLNSNKEGLIECDGCLVDPHRPFVAKIPQTIKDAMEICRSVGETHLWVDALCIIQDDDADRDRQIHAMDYIYSSSALTLASTCGDSAEASIPRTPNRDVSSETPTSFIQTTVKFQSLTLSNRPWSFARAVQQSKWSTRAWTCQEQILSSRTLFLTPQQMFFKCHHSPSYLSEDLDIAPKQRQLVTYPMNDTGTDLIPSHGSINVLTYTKTVGKFTLRSITYPDDVLNAFAGIAERMRTIFRSGFLYGLPQSEMDYALAWQPRTGAGTRSIKRRVSDGGGGVLFPTWSWAGWFGAVEYTFENRLPRVRWVHDHKKGALRRPEEYRLPAEMMTGEEGLLVEWRRGWTEKRSHSGFRYFYHESDQEAWFRHPIAPEADRGSGNEGPTCVPGTQHLRFEAEIIDLPMLSSFTPPSDVDETLAPLWQFPLTDDEGCALGYFAVPLAVAKEMSSQKKYKFVRISRVGHGLTPDKIMLKKAGPVPESKGTRLEDDPDLVYENLEGDKDLVRQKTSVGVGAEEWMYDLPFDRLHYDPSRPFCLNEFLVVEVVDDVAYRIGIGRMHADAWAQEPPKMEVVELG